MDPFESPDSSDVFNSLDALKDYILSSGDTLMFKESWLKIWEVIIIVLGIPRDFVSVIRGAGLKLRQLTFLQDLSFGLGTSVIIIYRKHLIRLRM